MKKDKVGCFQIGIRDGEMWGVVMCHRLHLAHHVDRRFAVWVHHDGFRLGKGWRETTTMTLEETEILSKLLRRAKKKRVELIEKGVWK